MTRLFHLLFFLLLFFAFSTSASSSKTLIKFVHAATDVPPIDIFLTRATGASPDVTALSYGHVSPYLEYPGGSYNIRVTVANTQVPIVTKDVTLENGGIYTFVLSGQTKVNATHPVEGLLYREDLSPPSTSSLFKITYTHLCSDCGQVDVKLNGKLLFQNVDYETSTAPVECPVASTYVLQLFRAGDDFYPLLTLPNMHFFAGGVYTEFGIGLVTGNQNVSLSVINQQEQLYSYFQWRAVHSAPQLGKLDIYFDDGFVSAKVIDGISFNDVTSYRTDTLKIGGNLNVTVVTAGTNEVLLSSFNPFLANGIYSFAIVGLSANSSTNPLSLWTYGDSFAPPSSPQKARIRFVHLAPSTKSLDVYGNDLSLFSSIPYKQASSYVEVDAHTYRLQLYAAGDTANPIVTNEKIKLEPGNVYTIFAEGMTGHVTEIIAQDTEYYYGYLKVSHASPDAPPLDIWINKQKVFSGVRFTGITQPLPLLLTSSTQEVDIVVLEQGTSGPVLLQDSFDATDGIRYMYAVLGLYAPHTPTPLEGLLVEDNWKRPESHRRCYIRFMHASPGVPAVNVLVNGSSLFENIQYTKLTDYLELIEGSSVFEVRTNGDNILLLNFNMDLHGDKVYTLFLEGIAGQTLQQVSAEDYQGLNSSYLRIIHASPDIGGVDVLLNGEAAFFGLEYTTGSNYLEIIRGAYKLAVTAASKLSPVYVSKNIGLPDKKNHTLIIVGQYSGTKRKNTVDAILLQDDDTIPDDKEKLRVRFFHASPNVGPLDIYADDLKLWDHIPYGSVSNWTTVQADDYKIHLRIAGQDNEVGAEQLSLEGHTAITLIAEGYYNGHPELKVVKFIDAGVPNPSPPSPSPSPSKPKEGGIPAWGWALIVVGIVVFIAAAVIAGILIRRRMGDRQGYTEISRS